MRGTQIEPIQYEAVLRFIPAYAGNTVNTSVQVRGLSVHPRVCGEHSSSRMQWRSASGSSPRMRGTLRGAILDPAPQRFIPAYAGNTGTSTSGFLSSTVHPRVCGEHFDHLQPMHDRCGSSPRMRGTRKSKKRSRTIRRFIPAYAGNTYHEPGGMTVETVHPRVCGEHMSTIPTA